MPDRVLAPETLQGLRQLHPLSPPAAPSQPEVTGSAFNRHDTMRYDALQDLEQKNGHENSASQISTSYTALLDVLVSQSPSSAENNETDIDVDRRHIPSPDGSIKMLASGVNLSSNGQSTTLGFRFGSILALINDLVQRLGALSEKELDGKELTGKELPYTRPRDVIHFLEGCMLDLRIWSKDLTTNDAPALDRLDDMKHPQKGAAVVIVDLHETMADIADILLPLVIRLSSRRLSESASDPPKLAVEQSHRVDTAISSPSGFGGNLLELSMACDKLESLLGKLLAKRSAIREILDLQSTKRFTFTGEAASESKAGVTPSIICFDGGGVRGYSSLLILKALMERVHFMLHEEETTAVQEAPSAPELKPADVFDFTYGSSSGGLIAIMLGRLGMTIDECIAKYLEYTKEIFGNPRRFSVGGFLRPMYSQKRLIQATRRIVGEFDPSSKDEGWRRNIFSSSNAPCKTGVIAWNSELFEPYMFRTYDCFANPDKVSGPLNPGPANSYQIWQIAMATAAAPNFFGPAEIEGQVFADGGITANNPTQEALRDLYSLYDTELSDICVVSIGCGSRTKHRVPKHISKVPKTAYAKNWGVFADAARQLIAQTESTHKTVSDLLKQSDASYFRFNIGEAKDIRLDEWQKAELIADLTHQYLQDSEVQQMLNDCAYVLLSGLRGREGKAAKNKVKQPEADKARTSVNSRRQNLEVYNIPFSLRGVPVATEFIDRPIEMARLEEVFFTGQIQRRKIFVLTGLGGIGKSQLSVEFARKNRQRFSSVFWLDGRSEDTLRQSIAAIAYTISGGESRESSKIRTPDETVDLDAVVKVVINWLSLQDNDSWLLIYDNVDQDYRAQALQVPSDVYDVRGYFPNADHGSILITTRLLNLGQLGTQLVVGRLDNLQATALFNLGYGGKLEDFDECKKLLNILDGLPLALIQASTFIRETATSFSDYISFYEERWTELMGSSQMLPQGYENSSVLTAWALSYDAINQRDESAAKLLQLWACLDNGELWFELFQPAFAKLASVGDCTPKWFQKVAGDKFTFLQSTKLLLGYSMINSLGDSSGYSIHRVVHQWLWETQKEDCRVELIALATLVVGLAVPHNSHKGFWITQQRLLPHADRCARLISELDTKGYALRGIFDACEDKESRHILTLEAFHNIGNLYSDQGKLAEAKKMDVRALAGYEQALGRDHTSTLDVVNDLGRLYNDQGKLKEAESMYQRALVGYEQALGSEHPSVLNSVNNLGCLYNDQGKLKEAESMYQRALVGYEQALGSEHPSVLNSVNNLGRLYNDQGKLKEAELMYQRALVGYEQALGSEHPSVLNSVNNLGRLYNDQGKLKEAELMYQRALVGYEQALGRDHTSTLNVVNNLGRLYNDQGKLAEAGEMYQRALNGYEKAWGPKHISTLDTVNNLGILYANQGKLAEAEKMYRRALDGYKKMRGLNHPSTKLIGRNLSELLGT